uniref:CASP-like protein n=1 Tax=Kalanchoe fedtschenkoi TaxID=63787 RepID=A0A7N0VGE5_KALFE
MAPPQPSGLSPPPPMVQSPELGQQPVYSPPSTSTVLVVKLVCKALTAALIFISFIILVTNNTSDLIEFACTGAVKYVKFYEVSAYRYMLFIIVLALVYSLLQTAFSIFHITSQKRVHKGLAVLDFYGDLVLLYALATAAAAGFGATVDLRREISGEVLNEFFGKGNATSSMLFFASICTAVSLVLSK